jgi:hypothetical protein
MRENGKNIKLTVWEKFLGWFIIKPLLLKEDRESLLMMARGLPDSKMTRKYELVKYFAKELTNKQ